MKNVSLNTEMVYAFATLYQDIKIKSTDVKRDILLLAALVNGKHLHFMLADDDEDDRENFIEAIGEVAPQIRITMEPDGYRLMETLKSDAKETPDILFLDLNMPYKNGFECLDEIRKISRLESLPIIVYSTSSSSELINKSYEKGANLYIIGNVAKNSW